MIALTRHTGADQADADITDDLGTDPLEFDPDPEPAAARRSSRKRLPKAGTRTSKARETRIAAELSLYGLMFVTPISMRDDVCGPAIEEGMDRITAAMARILGRYPELADKLIETGVLSDWAQLFAAIWPVLKIVKAHHSGAAGGESNATEFDPEQFPAYSPTLRSVASAR